MQLKERESDILRASLAWLRMNGVMAWRNSNQPVPIRKGKYITGFRAADSYNTGSPDIFLCIKGKLYGLELKTSTGRASPAQCEWAERMTGAGAEYFLARSVDEVIAHYSPLLCR